MKIYLLLSILIYQSCLFKNGSSNPSNKLSNQVVEDDVVKSKTVYVQKGEGLFQVFNRLGLDNRESLKIINRIRDKVDISKVQVGDKVTGIFGKEEMLNQIQYLTNPNEVHIVRRAGGVWLHELKKEKLKFQFEMIKGELGRSKTLEEELIKKGVSKVVVGQAVNVLSCKINFRQFARAGDRYKLFIRKGLFKNKIIKEKLLFVSYFGKVSGGVQSYYYSDGQEDSTYNAYYTKDGEALIRSGLRFPLSRMHVRSSYGWRVHPVTGKRAFHRGVDLRARSGKSVFSVSSGKVLYSTYNKFAGNKIGLKHRDGSSSHYYHLNKRFVKKGEWVKTRQKIGLVGSTGRVTGAHLHFGFKNSKGRWINPLNKRMIASPKLNGSRFQRLSLQIKEIKNLINEHESINELGHVALKLD